MNFKEIQENDIFVMEVNIKDVANHIIIQKMDENCKKRRNIRI